MKETSVKPHLDKSPQIHITFFLNCPNHMIKKRSSYMEETLLATETRRPNLRGKVLEESRKIWKVAFPAMLARVTSFGVLIVTQAFIGHVNEVDLAGYALAQVFALRFANGIFLGMSSATETLCGQAFGAKHYHMLGIYLQRSWIINFATAVILTPLYVFSKYIFELLDEEGEIAAAAGSICIWLIPFIFTYVFSLTIQQYLQAQQRNLVIGYLSAGSFVIHVFLSWLFVIQLDLGVPGAMGSLITSCWLVVIGEFVYIFGGWCPETWRGFTSAAFSDLGPVLKLSLYSGVMIWLELWYNAVLVLLAGYMKNAAVAISAFSVCLNISALEFMLCLGFLASASVRVGNELGRGNAKDAKFSVKVILSTSLCMGIFFFVLCLVFGSKVGYLFTTNQKVVESVSSLSVLLAFSILLNSGYSVLTGIAVGSGEQRTVAYVNLGCYYGIGIPVGVLLGYVAHLQVKGIWIGMLLGVAMQTLALGYITIRTDWDEQVTRAAERLNKWILKPTEESNGSSRQRESE